MEWLCETLSPMKRSIFTKKTSSYDTWLFHDFKRISHAYMLKKIDNVIDAQAPLYRCLRFGTYLGRD